MVGISPVPLCLLTAWRVQGTPGPSLCLGDSPGFASVEDQKHAGWRVTTVTRAHRSHIYFRNLWFGHEQGFQFQKHALPFLLCQLIGKIYSSSNQTYSGDRVGEQCCCILRNKCIFVYKLDTYTDVFMYYVHYKSYTIETS